MVIHNNSSGARGIDGASSARAAATTTGSPEAQVNPLASVTRTLGAKLDELGQKRLLPKHGLPAIQDQHASLFVIPPDPDATLLMKDITKYVNNILAAKEHLSSMSPDHPTKASLAELLEKHEEMFVQLNDVATLIRFPNNPRDNITQEIGAELLGDAAKAAMKAFLSDTTTEDMRADFFAISTIKLDKEASYTSNLDDVLLPMEERWPKDIMPLNILAYFNKESFQKDLPIEQGVSELASNLAAVGMEKQKRSALLANPGLMIKEDRETLDSRLKKLDMPGLSKAEIKNGPSRKTVNLYLRLHVAVAKRQLQSDSGLQLRKVSYEVARHAPEKVMKEIREAQGTHDFANEALKGHPITQLRQVLDSTDPDYEKNVHLLDDFSEKMREFQADSGLSTAENLVNCCFESDDYKKVFITVGDFLDGKTDNSNQPTTGKAGKSKNKKKGMLAA